VPPTNRKRDYSRHFLVFPVMRRARSRDCSEIFRSSTLSESASARLAVAWRTAPSWLGL
jgi:hypothetical protein